jgi:hypothetical protein
MRCPSEAFKAFWLHRRNQAAPPPGIAYGSAWHGAMEAHYKAAECSEADLIDQARLGIADKWEDHGLADDHRTFERCFMEYKKYLKVRGLPWREEMQTVGWPENPFVEMSSEIAIPGARHPYTVKIDRLGRVQSQFYVEDHKTTSRLDKYFFKQFQLDNQMMGYATGAQLLSGRTIAGVYINCHHILKDKSDFPRSPVSFSTVRLQAWCYNYDRWLARLEHDLEEWKYVQDHLGMDPYEAADFAFPLNKWACHGRKYGRCSYVEVCSLPAHLRGRAIEEDYTVLEWNPLMAEDDFDA